MTQPFGLHSTLNRGPLKGGYAGKFLLLSLLAALPAILALVLVLLGPDLGPWPVYVGMATSIGLLLVLPSAFNSLLSPVRAASDALTAFADTGKVQELAEAGDDLAGRLVHEVRRAMSNADQARKQNNVDSTTDPLTGLLSRRAATRRLGSDLLRSIRDGKPMCFAIAEIENAEQLTTQFGHGQMDKVVKVVAERIAACLRRSDWVAHFGDHEFILGLWGVDLEGASLAVDRVMEEVDSNRDAPVRLNVGVCQSHEGMTPDRATTLCVSAMYRARKIPGSAVEFDRSGN